jgi:hypothetical protein
MDETVFDHLVGDGEKPWRHLNAEQLCGSD